MIRMKTRSGAALATLFLIFISYQSNGQSAPPDEIRKWENDIARFDTLNLVELSDVHTLLVSGSSSVRLWDSIQSDMAPYQVMQRGYGGAKLTDFNYYADRIIKAQQFKAIVIFVANDIAGVESDKDPKEVKQLFKDLVKQVRKRNPDTPVCWIEVTPTPKRWNVSPQIREASGLIEAYCDRNKDLHFISTFDQFTTPEGLPDSTLFREDMLHLNRDGYIQWADIIKTSLEEAGIHP
jgi:GDSL-like Lipase/Acylhydrolase family